MTDATALALAGPDPEPGPSPPYRSLISYLSNLPTYQTYSPTYQTNSQVEYFEFISDSLTYLLVL